MSAFEEISQRGDAAGPETIALLRRLGAQVTRSSPFPPPDGHSAWTAGAVDDLLADLFASRGQSFVVACYTLATDQGSLERLILKTIKNFLIDQAKGTARGKLRRRLETILGGDGRFLHLRLLTSILAWALLDGPKDLWQGDIDQLLRAAFRVRGFEILSWNTAGRTSSENIDAIAAVSHAVLSDASGAVRDEDVARVIESRFALISPPKFVTVPDGRFSYTPGFPVEPSSATVDQVDDVANRVRELWAALSPEERALLPVVTESLQVRMSACGLGRAATEALTRSLADRLRLATQDDEDRDEVILGLAAMAGASR